MKALGFWDNVQLNLVTGCWEWTAGKCDGYGVVNSMPLGNKAHRVSWRLHFGDIPKGMVLMHKCDNRACVNPYHLEIGTHADNTKDMDRKGRRGNRRLTHAQVEDMRLQRAVPFKQLAKKYGVTPSHVSRIMRCESRTEDKTL